MSENLRHYKEEYNNASSETGKNFAFVELLVYAEGLEEKLLAAAPMREKPFKKPSVDALSKYAIEIDYVDFDPQNFLDFYEAKGWKIGKHKMKSWKGAVRTWKNRAHPPAPKVEAPVEVTDSMKYFWDTQDITGALERNEKFNMLLESKFRQLPPEHKQAIINKWKGIKEANGAGFCHGSWSQLCPP